MLKITLDREPKRLTLKLEGKLVGPWVSELENAWNGTWQPESKRPVLIDLSDVIFIDSEGEALLRSLLKQGARLQSQSLMTRFTISQISAMDDE